MMSGKSFLALLGALSFVTGEFKLAPQDKYAGMGLDSACEDVLYADVACNALVGELGTQQYHGTMASKSTTDSICAASCFTALSTSRKRVQASCRRTTELVEGYPVLSLIDSVIAGWNETCQKDADSGEYCNTIIDAFEDVDELDDMPQDEVCSYCFGGKLRMMQASPYSGYDEFYQEQLQYVNEKCNVTSPTDILPDPIGINYTLPDRCVSDRRYTVKDGDICDSIAVSNQVSSATLYYINPELRNCSQPTPGIDLCLPDSCERVYKLQSADEECVEVAVRFGATWQKVVEWNSGVDARCSNIWSTDPFWGRVLCLSTPNGDFVPPPSNDTTPGNGGIGGPGGNGEGYSDKVVDPPEGATVANGTTTRCGQYVQAQEGQGCGTIIAGASMTMKLFLDVNPSLGTVPVECSDNLVAGTWYCLHPHRRWNETGGPGDEERRRFRVV